MASPSSPRGDCWRRKEEREGRGGQEKKKRRRSFGEAKWWVKEEERGVCAEGPEPRVSHPEDLCSLAGWLQRRQREREETRGRYSKGGLGLIVTLLSLLLVASKGAPAASANFRLAQTCELLGAN